MNIGNAWPSGDGIVARTEAIKSRGAFDRRIDALLASPNDMIYVLLVGVERR